MTANAPTLEDVAALAGVSTATVSRCLNKPEQVVEKTRVKVIKAVETLGYAPNFSARSLVAKRTLTIGAVIPTMENAIFAEGIQAFQETLQAAGYTLLISSTGYDPKVEAEAVRTLVARGADGLLLIGQDHGPELYEFLERQRVPYVLAWTCGAATPSVSVGFDNHAAMRSLAEKAISLGHRRIGVISAHRLGNDRARARVAGVTEAIAAAGLAPAEIIETAYGIGEGAEAFAKLLKHHPDLTLVICGNDVLAAGAVRQARRMGVEVPGRVSVTGFDDIALAALVSPSLATVRVPHKAMGQAAAEAVLALVAGQAAQSMQLPVELCLRESLAAPSIF